MIKVQKTRKKVNLMIILILTTGFFLIDALFNITVDQEKDQLEKELLFFTKKKIAVTVTKYEQR